MVVDDAGPLRWPEHQYEALPWRQTSRGGTREDRMFREVVVSVPPMIATLGIDLPSSLAAILESAMREIAALDAAHGADLRALGTLLLRTESVASAKIEAIEAGVEDYARALHGIRSNPSAVSMVAATNALDRMISDLDERIELATVMSAHRALMQDDPSEPAYAGRFRDMQNWIGGSDHSPRAALYVPPPPTRVRAYMDDLLLFANRVDLPALVQAAIAHAQFESIHPFTDGNGRIGRALINAVLRRRGATTQVVVPLASALVAHRDRYFDLLDAYRRGDVRPLLTAFAESSRIAAAESRVTASRLGEMPEQWRGLVGPVRRGSATGRLLAVLSAHPILSSESACDLVPVARSSVFAAINRLREAGVLRPLTDRMRDQVWGAGSVLDELDDLGVRIAQASR